MLLIQETIINETKGWCVYEGDPYEPFTDDTGVLFRSLQREYGRCRGHVYIDPDARKIGWVFEKLVSYTDCNEKYLQSTWVTLLDAPPVKTIKYNHHYLV